MPEVIIETKATIEQELIEVEKEFPGFAPGIITAIEEGEINGLQYDAYGDVTSVCFYGHIKKMDNKERNAIRISGDINEAIERSRYQLTPIELLIRKVRPGQTQETSPKLAQLYEALNHHLSIRNE